MGLTPSSANRSETKLFTENTIKLSQFADVEDLQVVRDCAFSYVGKIPTRLERRIVACATPHHVTQALRETGIAGIVTKAEFAEKIPESYGLALSNWPRRTIYSIHAELCQKADFHWKSFASVIDASVKIHPTAVINETDVILGAGTEIGANAYIGPRTIIGNLCRIGPLCVVGCDAFEVAEQNGGTRILPHAGGVILDDNVELLAHCTIARSAFGGFTKVGHSSKIDAHVLISHDVIIGQNVHVAAGVVICGRVGIGHDVFVGPSSTIVNGVSVGEKAHVTAGAVVINDVTANQRVSGNFAVPHIKWLKFIAGISQSKRLNK